MVLAQAQTALREVLVHECELLNAHVCEELPTAANRPHLRVLAAQ